MRSYSYTYLMLKDVCKHNDLDYGVVMNAICSSDFSFGTNYDTLITSEDLDSILYDAEIIHDGLDYDEHDMDERILISLGS
jgi:hypothetical protein